MTAEERVEEDVKEGGQEGECVVEVQKEEEKGGEKPVSVVVDSVVVVEAVVVEGDGKVEGKGEEEEVVVEQTFTAEEPMPYGPDEPPEDGKEDDEECGFCLFMKAGPCGKRFAAWEACVDSAETAGTNIVEKCVQKTHFLKDCMEAHPEYYGPVLQAEKAMEAEQTTMQESKTGGEEINPPSNLESVPA